MVKRIVVLLGGGSGAGKTTVSHILANRFGKSTVLELDAFAHPLEQITARTPDGRLNLDHPSTYDFDQLYDTAMSHLASSPDPLIIEGIFALYDDRILKLATHAVYLEGAHNTRFSRRPHGLAQPSNDRAYELTTLIPMHAAFVEPTRASATLIINIDELNAAEVANRIMNHLLNCD